MAKLDAVRALLDYCQEDLGGENRVVDTVYHGECALQSDKLRQLIAKARGEIENTVWVVNWDDAPDWAEYFAVDSENVAYWYENKPTLNEEAGLWKQCGQFKVVKPKGRCDHWRESLTQRP